MHPGPVNRGVELAAEVIDSPQAVIGQQVEAGVVVRMAVLYELLAGPLRAAARPRDARCPPDARPPSHAARRRPDPRRPRARPARRASTTRLDVLDPRRRDRRASASDLDSRRRGHRRRRAGTCSRASSTRTCTCACPGQEHKEDLETGTRSAAAGGFVAVVAMPNTSPIVDSAPILRSLRESARREARVPVGFLASVTRGLAGEALTEMAELRECGALGFTDDGKPVHRAGILRKALQYQKLVRRGSSRCTRRTRRSPAAASCTRARSPRGSAWPASRASPSRR